MRIQRSLDAISDSQARALLVARAVLDKQAEDVVVLDLRALPSVTDFFVICTATSVRQLGAIREHLEVRLPQHGQPIWHVEGTVAGPSLSASGGEGPHWVLVDCGDVVVHLMDLKAREFYQLERLWADAPCLPCDANA